MCHYSVGDVDGEIIGRITSASLCHKNEVPGTVVCRAGFRDGDEADKAAHGRHIGEELFHCLLQVVIPPMMKWGWRFQCGSPSTNAKRATNSTSVARVGVSLTRRRCRGE